jgi:hypothetical protein
MATPLDAFGTERARAYKPRPFPTQLPLYRPFGKAGKILEANGGGFVAFAPLVR